MNILLLMANIQKSKLENQKNHYVFFLDFQKAFDSVNHSILLKILNNIPELHPSELNLIKLLLINYKASINGKDSFNIKVGVPQGSLISPSLFVIFINTMLEHIYQKIPKDMITDFEFADDCSFHCKGKQTLLSAIRATET